MALVELIYHTFTLLSFVINSVTSDWKQFHIAAEVVDAALLCFSGRHSLQQINFHKEL